MPSTKTVFPTPEFPTRSTYEPWSIKALTMNLLRTVSTVGTLILWNSVFGYGLQFAYSFSSQGAKSFFSVLI